MSAKSYARNDRGEPVKMPNWFSWRHQTRDAHDAAREKYLSQHGRKARQRKAKERFDRAHGLSPEARLMRAIFAEDPS